MTGEATSKLLRRYRRRIVGWGAVLLAIIFVIGALVSVPRVQDDLDSRGSDELTALGVDGATVAFSGQDGVVSCTSGPFDPAESERIVSGLESLRGVRTISIDSDCVASGGTATTVPAEDAPMARIGDASTADEERDLVVDDTVAAADTAVEASDFMTVGALVANDPQFSALMAAGAIAGADQFDVPSTLTVFAPTNEAFVALAPEVAGALNADPELMAMVLAHHVIDRRIPTLELEPGELTMLDGTAVTIEGANNRTLVSGDAIAEIVDPDLPASNGVVHAIDAVLLPADLDLGLDDPDERPDGSGAQPAEAEALVSATFRGGGLRLDGEVASEGQAEGLFGAATTTLAPANVVDALAVDSGAPLDNGLAFGLALLIGAMATDLVDGVAEVTADGLVLTGTVVDNAGRDSILAVTDAIGDVDVDLVDRPTATQDDAAAVESELLEIVASEPVTFEPSSALVVDGSAATFDRLAAAAKSYDGLLITVEGHTDSTGTTEENLALSQARADAVAVALIERGVPAGDLEPVGVGEAELVIIDGVEDAAASRRVVFAVALR